MGAKRVQVDSGQIHAVDPHSTFDRFRESRYKGDESALPRTGRARQGGDGAGFGREADTVEHRLAGIIFEFHVVENDMAVDLVQLTHAIGVDVLGNFRQNLADSIQPRDGLSQLAADRDDLDERGGSERLREPRKSSSVGSRSLKFGGTGGLAAVAVGGGVFGLISTIQYQAGYQNWEVIIAATGFGSPKEIEYWTLYVQPYKTRMVIGYVVAGVGLAASGAWFFVAPDGTVQVGISRRF